MMKLLARLLLLPLLLVWAACDSGEQVEEYVVPAFRVVADTAFTVADNGLKYYDFREGTGPLAETGDQVLVHYNGWLTDGRAFDSSYQRGQPLTFVLGARQVIAGWDQGIKDMRVGGERQLVIPPSLAYGIAGRGLIPPNATLIFEVELVGIPGTATP